MAAKLLAALNRFTLDEDVTTNNRVRVPVAAKTAVSEPGSNRRRNQLKVQDTDDVDGATEATSTTATATSKNSQGRESPFDESRHCKLCRLKFNSEEQLGQHIKGKRHEKSVRRSDLNGDESGDCLKKGVTMDEILC